MSRGAYGKGPRAVAAATEAKVVRLAQGTTPDSPGQLPKANRPEPSDFPLGVIWSSEHRGELIQFSICELKGSRYADLRRFFRRDGEWLHGRQGCTMPLSGLQGLHENLGYYLAANESAEAKEAA